jgi:transcriptional regulator with XRE-family HTH domain
VLDLKAILARRVELGLSRRRLRVLCGWSPNKWAALEDGTNHGLLTLDELQRLADHLGVSCGELLAGPSAPECESLDVTIEAILLRARKRVSIGVLAAACDTTPLAVTDALRRLRDRLQHGGTTVVLTSTGAELVAAAGAVTDEQLAHVMRKTLPDTGMDVRAAGLLRRILAGEYGSPISDTCDSERRWLSYLARLGYLRATESGFELAPDVAESLGAEGRPLRRLRRRDPGG